MKQILFANDMERERAWHKMESSKSRGLGFFLIVKEVKRIPFWVHAHTYRNDATS